MLCFITSDSYLYSMVDIPIGLHPNRVSKKKWDVSRQPKCVRGFFVIISYCTRQRLNRRLLFVVYTMVNITSKLDIPT